MYGLQQLVYWPSPRCAVAFAGDLRSRISRWTGKTSTRPVVQRGGLYWNYTTHLIGGGGHGFNLLCFMLY
jgi:hypothetical protein